MTRRRRKIPFKPACCMAMFLAMAGCASQKEVRVAEFEPYVGGRPDPVRPLQPLPPRPVAKRQTPPRGDAAWMPRGGITNRWECVVVHHSGSDRSTPQGMRDYHMRVRGWDELGYHFVIGNGSGYPDGQIFIGNRWVRQMHGAHCKTDGNHYNEHGIGICLIGNLDNHGPSRKQVAALARLASFLTQRCGIPQSKILTHGGITHKTACPGRFFSLGPVLRQMSVRSADASESEEMELAE